MRLTPKPICLSVSVTKQLPSFKPGLFFLYMVLLVAACGDGSVSMTTLSQKSLLPAHPMQLNDTGITECGDYAYGQGSLQHNNNASCNLQTDIEYDTVPNGQDAMSGRDSNGDTNSNEDGHAGFSFTKLSQTGASLPARAKQWACIQDNVTGLMWEMKTDDRGLHDRDWTYSWYEPDAHRHGGHAGQANSGYCGFTSSCDTQGLVTAVNKTGLCGAHDWRLPTREELRSLASLDRAAPAIDQDWFPDTQANWYWSTSLTANDAISAWMFTFEYGYDGLAYKSTPHYVRLVRSIH